MKQKQEKWCMSTGTEIGFAKKGHDQMDCNRLSLQQGMCNVTLKGDNITDTFSLCYLLYVPRVIMNLM